MKGFEHRRQVDRIRLVELGMEVDRPSPSPAPLCKSTQSSYISLTSLKRSTTRSRGLSVAYR